MNEDWKNALSALRGKMSEPENDPEPILEEAEEKLSQKNPLLVIVDKKGRNGKVATIIEGFTISQHQVEEIARKIKQQLGIGGSVREGEILVQGDHLVKVIEILTDLGFKTHSNKK